MNLAKKQTYLVSAKTCLPSCNFFVKIITHTTDLIWNPKSVQVITNLNLHLNVQYCYTVMLAVEFPCSRKHEYSNL